MVSTAKLMTLMISNLEVREDRDRDGVPVMRKFLPELERVEALQAGTSGWFAAHCRCCRVSGAHASAQQILVSQSSYCVHCD
jgi:hypothetical protein